MGYRSCLAPALALVGALLLHVHTASACDPNPCFDADLWETLQPVNAALIPSDGVLVLQGSNDGDAASWLEAIEVEVSFGGIPVDGALEAPGIAGVLVWRPAAPLQAGVHVVKGSVDNPDDLSYCAEDLALDFEFMVDAGLSVPLTPPSVTATELVTLTPLVDLTSIVCCDGVMPEVGFDSCGGGEVYFQEGGCGSLSGTGWLDVELPIAPMLPVATAGLLSFTLKVDGEAVGTTLSPQFSWRAQNPFCTEIEARNLGTGDTVTTAKVCHGDAVSGQLGPQELDPRDDITCKQSLQTCEPDALEEAWDPSKCTPWPGMDEESGTPTEGGSDSAGSGESGGSGGSAGEDDLVGKGCGCVGGDPPGAWALALLGIAGLRRRRRG